MVYKMNTNYEPITLKVIQDLAVYDESRLMLIILICHSDEFPF